MSRLPRIPGFDYRGGYRYFLTCCLAGRAQLFVDKRIVALVGSQFLRTAREHSFAVLAYVFMPDHFHALVEGPSDRAFLVPFMQSFRRRATLDVRQVRRGVIWQDGYHERVLRRDEDTLTVARYIVDNPVRAGLVRDWRDYPHSWSVELT